jgi:imidazolonepropionase-like amidohydrolase
LAPRAVIAIRRFFPPSMNQKGPYNVDSPEEGRKSVRTMHKYGAQVIKICATGGVFSHGDEPAPSSSRWRR